MEFRIAREEELPLIADRTMEMIISSWPKEQLQESNIVMEKQKVLNEL